MILEIILKNIYSLKIMVLICSAVLEKMIKTQEEVKMAHEGKDGNGLRYGFLKRQDVSRCLKVKIWL